MERDFENLKLIFLISWRAVGLFVRLTFVRVLPGQQIHAGNGRRIAVHNWVPNKNKELKIRHSTSTGSGTYIAESTLNTNGCVE